MRRAAKVDGTQGAIVFALREAGCKVLSLAGVANGCPDLLVCRPFTGWNTIAFPAMFLLEVKNLEGRGNKLTLAQFKFHEEWPVTVVTTPEEALRAVGL